MTSVAAAEDRGPVRSRFMVRLCLAFIAVALLAAGMSLCGKWVGSELALAGYSDDTSLREIVIGNNVISVPGNMVRFERARRDGVVSRLDLYMRWPSLDGYSAVARDDFNNVGGRKDIIFLAIEPKMMSRDMSGRFEPIYKSLIVAPGRPIGNQLTLYSFLPQSGYLNEELAVAPRAGSGPFVARCLTAESAEESLAPCERDVEIGDDLSVTYRFPRELLAQWQKMDASITASVVAMLKTGR